MLQFCTLSLLRTLVVNFPVGRLLSGGEGSVAGGHGPTAAYVAGGGGD